MFLNGGRAFGISWGMRSSRCVQTLDGMVAAAQDLASVQPESGGLEIAPDVNRWDKIQRGLPPELHKPKKPVIEEL